MSLPSGWRESWLPQEAEPSKPLPQRCAPCNVFRICVSPMIVLVFGIVGCSYGPYVLWLPHETVWSQFCVLVFHVLVALLLASYLMCVFTDPGTTPVAWHLLVESDERLASEHTLCRRSLMYRPLRSHFCSVTRRVTLNMDHFCPWVVNTVGFYNRKFFILFLLYTFLAVSWVLATSAPFLLRVYRERGVARSLERQWGSTCYMFAFMGVWINVALLIMLSCFAPFHMRMAMLNETTIEGPSPAFDVGVRRNWAQVFGSEPLLWFLPVWGGGPDGDGVHWPSPHVRPFAGSPCSSSANHRLEEGRLLNAAADYMNSDSSTDE